MKQITMRRLKKLEISSGISGVDTTIIIKRAVVYQGGKRAITGGTRIILGKGSEELPASYFADEGNDEEA